MTINPEAQGFFPDTEFGSRATIQRQRYCVVCGIEFERTDKITPIAPDKGLYFAHREHFEEPIPEPPGSPRGGYCKICHERDDDMREHMIKNHPEVPVI